MKSIILLFLTFLTFSTYADYIPSSKIGFKSDGLTTFMKKGKCESHYGETCANIPRGSNSEINELKDEMVDDDTKPIYEVKSNVVSCIDEADCIQKEIDQICDPITGHYKVRLADNSEVYCTKVLGYEQKLSGNKIVVENASKKAVHEASKQAKADAKASKKAKINALKDKLKTGDLNLLEVNDFLRSL